MNDKNNERLRLINKIKGTNVYFMAPPDIVKSGYKYFTNKSISGFRWLKNDLISLIGDLYNQFFVIHYLNSSGDLICTCTCKNYRHNSLCPHVVASVFTIKSLIDLMSQPQKKEIEPYAKELFNDLMGIKEIQEYSYIIPETSVIPIYNRQPERRDLKVIIDLTKKIKDVYFEQNGEKITYLSDCSYDLTRLISRINYHSYNKKTFTELQYPVYLRSSEGDKELKFIPNMKYKTFIEVSKTGRTVVFRKAVRPEGRDDLTTLVVHKLAIHPEKDCFGYIADKSGWECLNKIAQYSYSARDDIEMPILTTREEICYIEKDSFQSIVFKEPITEIHPNYIINLETKKDIFKEKKICLKPFMGFNENRFPIYPEFTRFFTCLLRGSYGFLRKFSTRKFILEMFLNNDASEIQKISLDRIMPEKFLTKRDKSLIKSFINTGVELQRSEQYGLLFHPDRWFALFIDYKRHLAVVDVLYKALGENLFRYIDDFDLTVSMPEDKFASPLISLKEIAKDNGIDIRLDNKPLRVSKWEISLDFTGDIDWFELHPEIKSNGRKIPKKLWLSILLGKGGAYIDTGDAIEVPDKETEQILKNIIDRMGISGNKQKSKEIIRIPRLQVLDWISLRNQGVRLSLPPEDEKVVESLMNFQKIEEKPIPQGLTTKLRHYQYDGYKWLCFLYEHRLGACLADDMGLGKTLQAISLLSAIKEGLIKPSSSSSLKSDLPHLIVVPPSLLFNWEAELKRFYPSLTIYQYTGSDRKSDFDGYDIVLTSYDILRRDIYSLKEKGFHVIIFDEAQAIKNIRTDRTSAVRQVNGYFKIALTGTPIENHLGEYYSIIDLVIPGLLGQYKGFKNIAKDDRSDMLDMVIRRTRPFILRRTKNEILKELPPKVESDVYLDLTPEQKAVYTKTVDEVRKTIDEAYRTKEKHEIKIIVLTALLKLRQICLCPTLLSADLKKDSPKIDFLIDRLRLLKDEGHSVLVFSQFTSFLDIVQKRLNSEDLSYLRLDGSTPVKSRKKIVQSFQEGKSDIFLLSLKAGGQGLNLTKATYVFHLDPWWNPAVESQATDRAHRIGQKRKVNAIRLLMRHTIEEKIMLLKKRKKALYEAVLGHEGVARGVDITRDDIEFLLS